MNTKFAIKGMGFVDCQACGRGLQRRWQGFALCFGKNVKNARPKFTVNSGQSIFLSQGLLPTTFHRYPYG
jgi:hypothetical protein